MKELAYKWKKSIKEKENFSKEEKERIYQEVKELFNHSDRRFLNRGAFHSTAAVYSAIEIDDFFTYPSAYFYMSDCSRTIELAMDVNSVKGLDNTIYKMQQIIENAKLMKEALEKIRPFIEELEKLE